MPDVFANITAAPPEMIDIIANVLEMRAAIPSQQEMIASYLGDVEFPGNAKVLEVGCGTGAICRVLAGWPNVSEVTGVDPSDLLIARARELARDAGGVNYQVGDGKALEFGDGTFDVVVLHTLLTHVPGPEQFLAEAHRVLKPDGRIAVCDGDFSTATLQVCELDPLEACTEAFVMNFVHDRFLVRRLTALVAQAGFAPTPLKSYGLVETLSPGLTMSWVDRGADALVQQGGIGQELADALKAEGRRRASEGTFFGYMAYASLTGQKA